MTVRRGTYVLFVTFKQDTNITVGAKGPHQFKAGTYCYVGSAMSGLDQRLRRHLAHEKCLKWHIDYLTVACNSSEAWESYPDPIPECNLGHLVEECGGIPEMDGFGCSDCDCRTHLFKIPSEVCEQIISRGRLRRHVVGADQTIN